jgi:two-component system OmpR family sensor kinase
MDGLKKRLSDSIQLRLSVALSVAILIVALLAGIFSFVSALDEAHDMQDDTLRQVALLFDRQRMTLQYPEGRLDDDNEEARVYVQYLADGSKAVQQDDAWLPLPLPTTLSDGISTLLVGGESFRVLVQTTVQGERIAVAQEIDARDKGARKSALRSLIPFLILFPVLLLIVGDLVRKLLRPIATLSAEIDLREEEALHAVDESHLPREIRPFVVAINRLLSRVRESMEAQGRFVADAAHELRSPLTALSLQAERLASVNLSIEARERLAPLKQGIERGKNLIDQMLTLAKAQSRATVPALAVSVHGVFARVLEDLLPLAEAKQIDIGVEGTDADLTIEEIDLTILVKNLVDNAIRYTPQGGKIDLRVGIGHGRVELQVQDSGPGVSPGERERIFHPFYRSLGSEQTGSGLGLSIVKAIADRTGAEIRLAYSDETGKSGLSITVTFPTKSV